MGLFRRSSSAKLKKQGSAVSTASSTGAEEVFAPPVTISESAPPPESEGKLLADAENKIPVAEDETADVSPGSARGSTRGSAASGGAEDYPPTDQALPDGWEKVVSEEGKCYYWHQASGQTAWELPADDPSSVSALEEPALKEPSAKKVSAMFEAKAVAAVPPPAPAPQAPPTIFQKWQQREANEGTPLKEASVKSVDIATACISGESQHAEAMRALQANVQSQPQDVGVPSARTKAVRNFERKVAGYDSGSSGRGSTASPAPGHRAGSSASAEGDAQSAVASARARLFQAKEEEEKALKSSQRQEAMRRLNAKGVVSTKQAFGVKSHEGSQHSTALASFQSQGKDVTVGFAHRSQLKGNGHSKGPISPVKMEGSQASSARAAILAKMAGGSDGQ